MLVKDKIEKLDLFDLNDTHLCSVPKSSLVFHQSRGREQRKIIIKSKNLPILESNSMVNLIALMIDGDRYKVLSRVSVSTEHQLNIELVDPFPVKVQDRRRFFKLQVNSKGKISFVARGEEVINFERSMPVNIKDINIGGVYIKSSYEFFVGDVIMLILDLQISVLKIPAEVLRVETMEGNLYGAGCKFLDITHTQEEQIAQFIYRIQLENRRRENKSE